MIVQIEEPEHIVETEAEKKKMRKLIKEIINALGEGEG